jgi:hypothetical protein
MEIETVLYRINWAKFRPGTSFFVPCINHAAARALIEAHFKPYKIDVITKLVINEGVKGLRVWRVV